MKEVAKKIIEASPYTLKEIISEYPTDGSISSRKGYFASRGFNWLQALTALEQEVIPTFTKDLHQMVMLNFLLEAQKEMEKEKDLFKSVLAKDWILNALYAVYTTMKKDKA